MLAVHGMDTLYGVSSRLGGIERVGSVDPLDHDDALLVLDLADDLAGKPAVRGVDLARLQRASEGAEQSAAGGGNDVVKGGGVGIRGFGGDAVVVGHGAVHAEDDRLLLGRHGGEPQRAPEPLNADARFVHHL
jgi:hypothetical protein